MPRSVRPRHDDPEIPEAITPKDLERAARIELKTLSKENADEVARHLAMASNLIDEDPALAHRHALAAARRAGRIAIVRETLAITAYQTGDFALALRELRTYRRISGKNDQLPLMVDSERGVGRPDRALELGRSVDRSELPNDVQVELAIAMSGARLDLGQTEAALAELEIPQLDRHKAFSYSPALFDAYATVLEDLGRASEAAAWESLAERAREALGQDDEDVVVVDIEEDESGAAYAADDLGAPVEVESVDVAPVGVESVEVSPVDVGPVDGESVEVEPGEGESVKGEIERDSDGPGDARPTADSASSGETSEERADGE
ncbi:hypothetical protein ACO2Q7_00010 [Rathayibacter sp. KR2-224]|uniref:hypothetical protein n=1 Tax=Rathayibacter sp. KR2-224 TaxID=3400913 RepID=UPI003C09E759